MGIKKVVTVSASLMLLISFSANSETVTEIAIDGGYSNNVFSDSSLIGAGYTTITPSLKFYPSSQAEVSAYGSWTGYQKASDKDTSLRISELGGIAGGAGLSFIPTTVASKFTWVISGQVYARSYGDNYELYNTRGYETKTSLSLSLRPTLSIRTGLSLGMNDYVNSTSGDNRSFEIFGGANMSLPGSNSLDLSGGFLDRTYTLDYSVYSSGGHGSTHTTEIEINNGYDALFISARISRPLGPKTGLNATYTERHFTSDDGPITLGFTIDNLSPWTSLWEGRSGSIHIKNFSIKNVITRLGYSYSNHDYIPVWEITDSTYSERDRSDTRHSIYFNLQRPITTASGKLITPTLHLEYLDNQSSRVEYDYSSFDVNIGLAVKF